MFETKKVTVHRADGTKQEIKLDLRKGKDRQFDWAVRAAAAEKTQSLDQGTSTNQKRAFKPSSLDF